MTGVQDDVVNAQDDGINVQEYDMNSTKIEAVNIHEQRTYRTRRNEFVVRKKTDYNSQWYHFKSDLGISITKIREESRRIYKIDGQFGLFFNLESSATFREMKRDENICIEDFVLAESELSLYPELKNVNKDTDMQVKEHEINNKMMEFQNVVSNIIASNEKYNEMEMHEISDSTEILAMSAVQEIVNNASFLVQQNRDLYNEFLHVACCYVPEKSEIASNVTLSWEYDLNDALYTANHHFYKDCVDLEKLARITGKLINCIQIHYKLEKGRTYHKKLLAFARKNKTKELKKRKEGISQAWLDLPGFKGLRALRDARLQRIQHEFFEATNWQRVKQMFETSLEREEEISQKYGTTKIKNGKRRDWSDDINQMDFDKSPEEGPDSVEQDDQNVMEDLHIQVKPNSEDENNNNDVSTPDILNPGIDEAEQHATIRQPAVDYLTWARQINRISIPDNIKSELNNTIKNIQHKVRTTTMPGVMESHISTLLALFKRKLRTLYHLHLTKDRNELEYKCNLELVAQIDAMPRPIDTLSERNLTILKHMLKTSSTNDFNKNNNLPLTSLTTAYTNPYLI